MNERQETLPLDPDKVEREIAEALVGTHVQASAMDPVETIVAALYEAAASHKARENEFRAEARGTRSKKKRAALLQDAEARRHKHAVVNALATVLAIHSDGWQKTVSPQATLEALGYRVTVRPTDRGGAEVHVVIVGQPESLQSSFVDPGEAPDAVLAGFALRALSNANQRRDDAQRSADYAKAHADKVRRVVARMTTPTAATVSPEAVPS